GQEGASASGSPSASEPPSAVGTPSPAGPPSPGEPPSAAESIRRSRLPQRIGVRELLEGVATEVTPLSGTGAGERDPGLLLALARVGSVPCVVLGHDRGS
ncbi:hypothetical protein ADK38_19020, partial [Streptomyces varsoviensis]